ncbi:MAG: 5-formyltetrahydrofolate cyclo-ligase [Bacteroidia bacterium]|nr:5-formyltetrahydrofolate cyclo-ligase [Bacteroidia bacterium]
MQIIEQKTVIRKHIKELKFTFDKNQLEQYSLQICNKVAQLEQFHKAKYILLYSSLPYEVSTVSLFKFAKQGKILVLPVVVGEDLILKEYIPSKLKVGYMNILEPSQEEIISPELIDLAIVPGVAFDSNCNRMGRGKGYYDRLLLQMQCAKIGIGFHFQIVDKVPTDNNDIKMDLVITDCNVYSCTQGCQELCSSSQ